MKNFFILFLSLLPVAIFAADPIGDLETRQVALFERVAPCVVFISGAKNTLGSGFLISADGLILTNAHVVPEGKKVNVVLNDGKRFEGTVIERAKNNIDLALVKIEAKGLPFLDISKDANIKVGSWAAAIGHGRGAVWTYNTGMISNVYIDKEGRAVIQTQIPINRGNSGGPVFDKDGVVVGVVTAEMTESNSINFALSVDLARNNLEGLSHLSRKLIIRAPEGLPIFVNGIMKGKGPQIALDVPAGTYEIFIVQNGEMKKVKIKYPQQKIVELPTASK
ncbi:MAG TPA: serine protease [bacterium]|nr:serine protease [bacterium]HSA33743.1 serine protease [bacterium]